MLGRLGEQPEVERDAGEERHAMLLEEVQRAPAVEDERVRLLHDHERGARAHGRRQAGAHAVRVKQRDGAEQRVAGPIPMLAR